MTDHVKTAMTTTIRSPPIERSTPHRAAAPVCGPRRLRRALPGCCLLVGTAVLYLWGLGAAGWANEFYAAAVQAGTQSWKALLFGSLDAGNAITVDKPPAALWVMGLSGRIFGFNSWSMLVPAGADGRRRGRRCCTPRCAAVSGPVPGCWPVRCWR